MICTRSQTTIFYPSPMFNYILRTTLPGTGREQGEWLRYCIGGECRGPGKRGTEEGNPSAKLQSPCTPQQLTMSLSCHSELFDKSAFPPRVSLMMVSAVQKFLPPFTLQVLPEEAIPFHTSAPSLGFIPATLYRCTLLAHPESYPTVRCVSICIVPVHSSWHA